jgi:flagellar motor protein MotB
VLFVLAALVPLCGGCLSQGAVDQAMKDRDAEIDALRTERATLKQQLEVANADKQHLQNSLQEASMNLALKSVPQTADAPVGETAHGPSTAGYDDLDVPVDVRDGRLVITLPSAVAFGSGKAELSSNGKGVLDKLSQHLKKDYPSAHFYIEGHTDTDPIQKSSFASNRELSMARAVAVLTYLVESCKIPDDQFVVVGHGQYQPIASNASAEGKAKNRRVEIIVHTEKD